MDYEQKYNKLVNAIKVLQEANPSDEGIRNWVNDNVPELAESKDEKVRKWLYGYFHGLFPTWILPDITCEEILAWLEKQKSEEINVKALLTADRLAAAEMTGRLKERKDIVENPQKYGLEKQGEQKSSWSKEDEGHLHSIYHYLRILKDESDNDSVKKNIEEHINWLSKLYQIFLASQPKQLWSEEDERMFRNTIALIETVEDYNKAPNGFGDVKFWLKSIKQRIRE